MSGLLLAIFLLVVLLLIVAVAAGQPPPATLGPRTLDDAEDGHEARRTAWVLVALGLPLAGGFFAFSWHVGAGVGPSVLVALPGLILLGGGRPCSTSNSARPGWPSPAR